MKHETRLQPAVLWLFAVLFGALAANAQTHTPKYVSMTSKSKAYYEYLPEGYNPTGTTTYPLILFMTGIGEFGDGSATQLAKVLNHGVPKVIADGLFPKSFTAGGATHRFIVVSPQFLKGSNPTAADINTILNNVVSKYKVNTKRIYMTGLSYGGGLSFAYPGGSSTYAGRIAAIVPISSPLPDGGYATIYARSRVIAAGNVPVWATHNSGDTPDSASRTTAYINYINQSPAPKPLAKKTIFTASGHDAWTKTYNPDFRESGYSIYEWMLLHQKGVAPPAANAVPTANAGADKTITLPTSSVTLSGSGADSDGSIIAYKWTKVSGPVEGSITSSTAASTSVTGLVRGIYTFRLLVSDTKSAKAPDDVKVTVNPAAGTKTIQVNIYGGANAYSNTTWNNWSVGTTAATNKTSTAFKYVDGASSTATAVLSATTGVSDNGSTYGTGVAMAPGAVLRYTSAHTALRTLTLKGLTTTKTYALELYASRSSSTAANTVFTINGVSKTIAAYNNFTGKALFTGLKANSSGQLVVSINQSASYNYLNGFVLTETATSTTATKEGSVTLSNLPLAEAGADASLSLYPNPASDRILLRLNNNYTGAVLVQLHDASGRVYKTFRFAKGTTALQQSLPLQGLPGGLYYITVQSGNTRTTTSFAKL